MIYLGDFATGSTVRGMWNSNAIAGESITRATNGSIRIYKDNSTTERSSSAGITDTEDFDSLTGVHHYNIDTSDNTDSGFYAAGHDYFVVLSAATIDGKTINAFLGTFSIENRNNKVDAVKISGDSTAADNLEASADGTGYNLGGGLVVAASVTGTIAHSGTASAGGSATITLAGGASATDDIYNYQRINIKSGTGAGQSAIITDYNGTTKVATVDHTWQTTPDNTSVYDIPFSRVPRDVSKVTGNVEGSVEGDVEGKILGGGASTITDAGVWALDDTGSPISGGGGGGTDWTADEKTAIKTILGVPASGTTPDTPSAGALKDIDDLLDTEIAAIKAKTDNLPSDPADASDIAASFSTVNSTLSTIAGYIDTEIAAIKAKTDNLPSDPADASDIASAFTSLNTKVDTIDDFLDTEIASIKTVTDHLATAIELDGSVYRFTTNALEQSPGGGISDTGADISSTPNALSTRGEKLDWLFAKARNAQFTTSTVQQVCDDSANVVSEAVISSDGTTVTRNRFDDP